MEVIEYIYKGTKLLEDGKYKKALKMFDKALKIEPNNFYALLGMSLAYTKLNKLEEALKYVNKALEIAPDTNALFHKAWLLTFLEQYENALKCFDDVLSKEPNNIEALVGKSRVLTALENYKEALEYVNKALSEDPNNAELRILKGIILAGLGLYEEAEDYFKILPINVVINLEDGSADITNPDEIIKENKNLIINIINKEEKSKENWVKKGNLLRIIDFTKEAIDCYNKALDIDNKYVDAWIEKGRVLLSGFKNYDEALKCFETALSIEPNNKMALIGKALSLAMKNKYDEAITYIKEAFKDEFNNEDEFWNVLGELLQEFDKDEDALKCFERALKINPNNIPAIINKINALLSLGKRKKAISFIIK
ncbi:tetratricopeptide repeat protein [Methanocaldococcus sp. 10A]